MPKSAPEPQGCLSSHSGRNVTNSPHSYDLVPSDKCKCNTDGLDDLSSFYLNSHMLQNGTKNLEVC